MPYIKANNIRFAFDTYGDLKKKPLILMHGLGSQRLALEKLAKELMEERFVITYDLRGQGQSERTAEYSLEDTARDLLAIIETLGYDKVEAMGISQGSYILQQAAIMDCSKFEKIILGVPKPYDMDGTGSSTQRILKSKGVDIKDLTVAQMNKYISQALWCEKHTPEELAAIQAKAFAFQKDDNYVPLSGEDAALANQSMIGFDFRNQYDKITCPALVIQGRYDGINPVECGEYIADHIHDCELVIFENSGHMAFVEEPERYAYEMKKFLGYSNL